MPRVRVARPTVTLVAMLPLVACTPSQPSPKVAATPPSASATPTSSANSEAAAPLATPIDPDTPDPSKLLADDYAGDSSSLETRPAKAGQSGLVVTVNESGPNEPWVVRVINQGEVPAELIADTRLLWFEVKLPGQKKTTACKLPETTGLTDSESRLRIRLAPGEGVVDTFDPRLYCFSEGDQKFLVPGATISPHFGWAEAPPKKRWKGGKLVEEPVLQRAPFVARRIPDESPSTSTPPEGAAPAPAEAKTPTATKAATQGKAPSNAAKKNTKKDATLALEALAARSDKELLGNVFTLQSEYAVWSRRPSPTKPEGLKVDGPAMGLRLVQGSDARAEHNATVQITLENQSTAPTYVYFRREMVSFEVTGPKGITVCVATPDERNPERRAFVKLEGHGKRTYSSRLAELCPLGTFALPGLYLVDARFDATQTGEAQGLQAFVGPVQNDLPATVRIRVGDAPLLHKRMMPLGTRPADTVREKSPDAPPPVPGHP